MNVLVPRTGALSKAFPAILQRAGKAAFIGVLDDEGLSTRKAEGRTGVSHADFTRIRNVQLERFTIDRLMTVLNKLGQHVDVQIDVQPRVAAEEAPAHP